MKFKLLKSMESSNEVSMCLNVEDKAILLIEI